MAATAADAATCHGKTPPDIQKKHHSIAGYKVAYGQQGLEAIVA